MRIKRACTGVMLLVNAEHTMEIKVKNQLNAYRLGIEVKALCVPTNFGSKRRDVKMSGLFHALRLEELIQLKWP